MQATPGDIRGQYFVSDEVLMGKKQFNFDHLAKYVILDKRRKNLMSFAKTEGLNQLFWVLK